MGCQTERLFANTWLAVFGVFFRIHRFTQRRALHPKSNPAFGSNRDDVMVRVLDRTDELEHAVQHRRDFNAHADRLSLCRGYPTTALALHDTARCFLSSQHPARFLVADRSLGHDHSR